MSKLTKEEAIELISTKIKEVMIAFEELNKLAEEHNILFRVNAPHISVVTEDVPFFDQSEYEQDWYPSDEETAWDPSDC